MKAVAVNRRAAAWMGIPVERMVALSFALSAGLGALAGVVVTPLITTQFNIGLPFTLKGFAAAVIGGLGNIGGAIVGGLILGVLEALSSAFVSSMYGDAVTYGILLVILLVRPSGLFRPLVEASSGLRPGALADLAPGDSVVVQGKRGPDGTITAATVTDNGPG